MFLSTRSALLLAILFSSIVTCQRKCPMKVCRECVPFDIHDAPGIGFDLSISYGYSILDSKFGVSFLPSSLRRHSTAFVHDYNGTVTNVGKYLASNDYLQMMTRFGNSTSTTPIRRGILQEKLRQLRKYLCYPATKDVGTLASLIVQLRDATQALLGSRLTHRVVVTSPLVPSLSQEDLNDALEFAGLRSWLVYRSPSPKRLSESKAIYAANGYGLCHTYERFYTCKDEERLMELNTVYTVTYQSLFFQ